MALTREERDGIKPELFGVGTGLMGGSAGYFLGNTLRNNRDYKNLKQLAKKIEESKLRPISKLVNPFENFEKNLKNQMESLRNSPLSKDPANKAKVEELERLAKKISSGRSKYIYGIPAAAGAATGLGGYLFAKYLKENG